MFRQEHQTRPEPILLPASSKDGEDDQEKARATPRTTSSYSSPITQHLPSSIFNQGYYRRFFREGKRLGRGAKGQVFLAQHVLENETLGEYAVKKIPVGDNASWLQRMLREVHIMEGLRHPNVVAYKHSWLEVCQLSPFAPAVPCLFILMEYADRGNLEDWVYTSVRPEDKSNHVHAVASLFLGICKGLEHLHRLGIIHRDLKPQNILITSKDSLPQALISDFGECNFGDRDVGAPSRTGATGTIEFSAPELLRTDSTGRFVADHSTQTDAWSLGMLLYYMLSAGQLPWENIDDIDILRRQMLHTTHLTLDESIFGGGHGSCVPTELLELLRDLLSLDPSHRPHVCQVIERMGRIIPSSLRMIPRKVTGPLQLPGRVSPWITTRRWFRDKLQRYYFPSITFLLITHVASSLYCYPRAISWTFYLLVGCSLVSSRRLARRSLLLALLTCLWLFSLLILNKTVCSY